MNKQSDKDVKETLGLFIISSIILTTADFIVSNFVQYILLPGVLPVSIISGRLTGAIVGYLINRDIVFQHSGEGKAEEVEAVLKYLLLWIINYILALLIVTFLCRNLGVEYWISLMIAGALLYIPSYCVQRFIVFRDKSDDSYKRSV